MKWKWPFGDDKEADGHAEDAIRGRYDNAIRYLLELLGADDDRSRPSQRGALEELRKRVKEVVEAKSVLMAKNESLKDDLKCQTEQAERAQRQFGDDISRLEDEKSRLIARLRTEKAEHAAQVERENARHAVQLERENARHVDQLERENSRHLDQLAKAEDDWSTNLGNLKVDYETRLEKSRQELRNYQSEMRSVDNSWRSHVVRLEKDHRDAMATGEKKHNDEIQRLKAQLMTHGSNHQGWNDTRLSEAFKEIGFDIDLLASTQNFNNLHVSARPGSNLDPTGFLERNTGIEHPPLLLRSQIWKTLKDEFFSLPFGFGSLGPQATHELEKLCLQWQHLLKAGERPNTISFDDLFGQNIEANMWRSSTFVTISTGIHGRTAADGIGAKYAANVDRVSSQLGHVWEGFFGGVGPNEKTQKTLRSIASRTAELALQFGIHRATLLLRFPEPMSRVTYGPGYHHYRNKDLGNGKTVLVDLVSCPGFLRVGDGRRETGTEMQLSPAKVVPRQDS